MEENFEFDELEENIPGNEMPDNESVKYLCDLIPGVVEELKETGQLDIYIKLMKCCLHQEPSLQTILKILLFTVLGLSVMV